MMADSDAKPETGGNEWEGLKKGFCVLQGGKIADTENFILPFFLDLEAGLKDFGLSDTASDESIINELLIEHREEPTAAFGPDTILWGVTVFLGSSAGSWALQKVFDEIYNTTVRPNLIKLAQAVKSLRESKGAKKTLVFKYGAWSESSKVYISIVAQGTTSDGFSKSTGEVQRAYGAAIDWIRDNKIKQRVVTISIQDGVLDEKPIISDVIPRETRRQ